MLSYVQYTYRLCEAFIAVLDIPNILDYLRSETKHRTIVHSRLMCIKFTPNPPVFALWSYIGNNHELQGEFLIWNCVN